MSSITLAEIKTILKLDDPIIDKEATTIDSNAFKRLSNKRVVNIYRVDTDTKWSTASAYSTHDYYTTKDYASYTLLRRISTGTIGTTEVVYVSYSYNEYDDLIKTLLPQVEKDLCEWLNNYFEDEQTEYLMGRYKIIARAGTSHPQITDTTNSFFLAYGFQSGMDIRVCGTERNEGIYHISSAVAAKIKLSSGDTCLQETDTDWYGGTVKINRIKWPQEIKKIIAYIIWHNISRAKDQAIQSKSLGPSSITYASIESGSYPPSIYESLRKYRRIKMI